MGQLVLSEDATLEIDGNEVTLPKGTSLNIDRNAHLFRADADFQVNTPDGRMLIEAGDVIEVCDDGDYRLVSESTFVSDGNEFVLSEGDTINIMEQGFWAGLKRGLGYDPATQLVHKIINGLMRFRNLIAQKAEIVSKKTGRNPYDKILTSEEMETINDIHRLAQSGMDIGEIVDMLDLDDPAELVGRMRDALMDIGDERLAKRAEDILPSGLLNKAQKVLRRITGEKMAKGELTKGRFELAVDDLGYKYRITKGDPRMAYPLSPKDEHVYKEKSPGEFVSTTDSKRVIKLSSAEPKQSATDEAEKAVSKAVSRSEDEPQSEKSGETRFVNRVFDLINKIKSKLPRDESGRVQIGESEINYIANAIGTSPEKVRAAIKSRRVKSHKEIDKAVEDVGSYMPKKAEVNV